MKDNKITCPNCDGNGIDENNDTCPECKGAGKVVAHVVKNG